MVMNNFIFDVPTKIFFGKEEISKMENEIKNYASKVLIVFGSNRIKTNGLFAKATAILDKCNIKYFELGGVKPNPRIDSVREGVKICKNNNIDFILAIGGGSTIDCAKAIAAGAYHNGDVWDFYIQKATIEKALPIGTILTLAATGSEMNGNSVISNMETKQKLAVGYSVLKPKFSVLDPINTFTVPNNQTAAGTVDIMSHIFEFYLGPVKDTFIQDRLAEALLLTCIEYAPIAMKQPDNYDARANLLWAGTFALNGVIGSGKIGDWACHTIEHAVSAVSDIVHGVGLAILTPAWMNFVLDDNIVDKFVNLSVNVWNVKPTNDKFADARAGIMAMTKFFASLDMPSKLSEVGITEDQLPVIADKAVEFYNPGNLKLLTRDNVLKILESAF